MDNALSTDQISSTHNMIALEMNLQSTKKKKYDVKFYNIEWHLFKTKHVIQSNIWRQLSIFCYVIIMVGSILIAIVLYLLIYCY